MASSTLCTVCMSGGGQNMQHSFTLSTRCCTGYDYIKKAHLFASTPPTTSTAMKHSARISAMISFLCTCTCIPRLEVMMLYRGRTTPEESNTPVAKSLQWHLIRDRSQISSYRGKCCLLPISLRFHQGAGSICCYPCIWQEAITRMLITIGTRCLQM